MLLQFMLVIKAEFEILRLKMVFIKERVWFTGLSNQLCAADGVLSLKDIREKVYHKQTKTIVIIFSKATKSPYLDTMDNEFHKRIRLFLLTYVIHVQIFLSWLDIPFFQNFSVCVCVCECVHEHTLIYMKLGTEVSQDTV
jgi:hypothetical protein